MKLRNKKTGEIGELQITEKHCAVSVGNGTASCGIEIYSSLAELNEEWEDYEEPKEYWYIDDFGRTQFSSEVLDEVEGRPNNWMIRKLFGNYFETKEEAKKAVEKLKAWKRLRDRGFEFKDWKTDVSLKNAGVVETTFNLWADLDPETVADLDLLFNQEDD